MSGFAAVATLALAWAGYCATHAAFADEPAAKPKEKADHSPVVTLRDRMLQAYHGQTTNLFTSITGFGMERMQPLYKVVPFEVPDFSTNEVESGQQIAPPDLLKQVFDSSVNGFRDPSKPIPPIKRDGNFNPFNPGPGFGRIVRPQGGAVVSGLQLRLLDLVGLTDPDGPKVYSGGKAFELQRMTAAEAKKLSEKNPNLPFGLYPDQFGKPGPFGKFANGKAPDGQGGAAQDAADLETRPLDLFETAGVVELSQGKDLYLRHKDNVIRMLGALRATDQCLKCHSDSKRGDLLGAFSYTFVDTNNTLAKELKKGVVK